MYFFSTSPPLIFRFTHILVLEPKLHLDVGVQSVDFWIFQNFYMLQSERMDLNKSIVYGYNLSISQSLNLSISESLNLSNPISQSLNLSTTSQYLNLSISHSLNNITISPSLNISTYQSLKKFLRTNLLSYIRKNMFLTPETVYPVPEIPLITADFL